MFARPFLFFLPLFRYGETIGISVQVSSGATHFRVLGEAESVEQALEIERLNPGKACEVAFPIDPGTFFVEDAVPTVRQLAA